MQPRSYEDAKALFSNPQWKPTFSRFESRARVLAKEHGVRITAMEPNVGVFMSEWEPSYKIRVAGDPEKAKAFNAALGAEFKQRAVVGFQRDKKGKDIEVKITGAKDPNETYGKLVGALGAESGASFDTGAVRVFVDGGDAATAQKVVDVAKASGGRAVRFHGHGHYLETRAAPTS